MISAEFPNSVVPKDLTTTKMTQVLMLISQHDGFFGLLQFVAHPNVQQLLASIWYDGLPGFRQMNMILQFLEVCRIGLLFPFFSLAYILCPRASWSQKLRKPFIKFICTSFSYFTFLCKYCCYSLPFPCIPKGSS